LIEHYADRAMPASTLLGALLARIWKAERFSCGYLAAAQFRGRRHRQRLQRAELDYLVGSRAAATHWRELRRLAVRRRLMTCWQLAGAPRWRR